MSVNILDKARHPILLHYQKGKNHICSFLQMVWGIFNTSSYAQLIAYFLNNAKDKKKQKKPKKKPLRNAVFAIPGKLFLPSLV